MIGDAISEILNGSVIITNLFGDKIYPVMLPQQVTGTSLVYGIKGIDPIHSKNESHLNEIHVQFLIFSKDFALVQSAARALRSVLNKNRGTYAGITISDIEFDDYQDGTDSDHERFCGVLDFNFYTDENFQ
jgi:hypothetical protein